MAKKVVDLIGLKKAFSDFYNGIKSIFVKRTDCLVGTSAPTNTTVADYVGQMYKYNGQIYVCTDIQGEETKSYTWSIGGVGLASINRLGLVKITNYSNYPIYISSDGSNIGTINIHYASESSIAQRSSKNILRSSDTDFTVKAAMTDGKGGAWTDAEKLGAWKRLTIIKTEIDDVLVENAQYYLGEQTELSITLPTVTANDVGEFVEINFSSGETACSLSTGLDGFNFVPKANKTNYIKFTCIGADEWSAEIMED